MAATWQRGNRRARARALLVALIAAVAMCSCGSRAPAAPVTGAEALGALVALHGLASAQTPEAMEQVCEQSSLTGCHGLSSSILHHPESAPGPGTPVPSVLCSRGVGDGAWMLVVEGVDGHDRPYVSQLVLDRDDGGAVVPLHEAAYWLGIAYHGTKVTGSTGLTTAHHPQVGVDPLGRSEAVLQRARAACDQA